MTKSDQELAIAELVDLLRPVVRRAGHLRGCGIRLVGDPETLATLKAMYDNGNTAAGEVLANLFPTGHDEVVSSRESRRSKSRVPVFRD